MQRPERPNDSEINAAGTEGLEHVFHDLQICRHNQVTTHEVPRAFVDARKAFRRHTVNKNARRSDAFQPPRLERHNCPTSCEESFSVAGRSGRACIERDPRAVSREQVIPQPFLIDRPDDRLTGEFRWPRLELFDVRLLADVVQRHI